MECRNCSKEFKPVERQVTKTYQAHRTGYCSDKCKQKTGAMYDMNVR